MNTLEQLRERVYCISERFPGHGIGPDIAVMTLLELEAVLRYLVRLSEGQS